MDILCGYQEGVLPLGQFGPKGAFGCVWRSLGLSQLKCWGILAYLVAGEAKGATKQPTGHRPGLRGKLQIANLASKGWAALRLDRSSSVKPWWVPTGCGRFTPPPGSHSSHAHPSGSSEGSRSHVKCSQQ